MCIHCKSSRSIRKGLRRTKQLGIRQIRQCLDCGRKFTPKRQKPVLQDSSHDVPKPP